MLSDHIKFVIWSETTQEWWVWESGSKGLFPWQIEAQWEVKVIRTIDCNTDSVYPIFFPKNLNLDLAHFGNQWIENFIPM